MLTPGPILLVDDDPDTRTLMTMMLEHAGLQVVTAMNGMEAFNVARARRPSLILLDLMMPVMSGEEFRNAQLANDEIHHIPVVVVSARHDARSIARRMKAAACLAKPIDFEELTATVRRHARPS